MGKRIRKMLIGDIWHIGEHESWFSDMAKEGWHLQKIGTVVASFERGEPKDTRYRIDTSSNKNMPVEDKEICKESGWELVTKFGAFNVFSSPVELQAPELYSDPVEQSYTLKDQEKKVRKNTIVTIILGLIGIVIFSTGWFSDTTSILSIIKGEFLHTIIYLFLYLVFAGTLLRADFSMLKLRKILVEGGNINHHAPWKKKRRVSLWFYGLLVGFTTVVAVMPLIQINLDKTQTLPMESADLPIVRLAEIEQNPNLAREEYFVEDRLDSLNQYTYYWSLVAPLQYQSNERGVVSDQLWQEGGAPYSSSIHTQVYKLNFPFIKEKLIADLTREYGLNIYEGDLLEMESGVFDILFIRQEDRFREVFAAKGKGVIYVSYLGHADTDTILEIVNEKLALIEK